MKKSTMYDFERNQSFSKKHWHNWLAFSMLLLFGQTGFAQISAYSFSQSQTSYESIAATGVLVTGSDATATTTHDGTAWEVSIPFDFLYNGTLYSSVFANSNGGATFGATNTGSALISSTTTTFTGAVALMNRDLWGVFYTSGSTTNGSNIITNVGSFKGIAVGKALRSGSGVPTAATVTAFDALAGTITMSSNATSSTAAANIGWGSGHILTKVDGTAPNRTFTIQWEGYNDYGTTSSVSNYLSFQLKLSETTNKVNIVYGDSFNLSTTLRTNQVGLRGATNADYNNRTGVVTNPWTATASGTTNSATVARDNVVFPASGLSFVWTPPTCLPPAGITISDITLSGATIGWTSPNTSFEIEYGLQNFVQGAGTTVTTGASPYLFSGLNSSTTYKFYIRTNCGAVDGLSNWGGPYTFTTLCGTVTAFTENFES
jgi:hypothetical protein